jgi:hypothetical protein
MSPGESMQKIEPNKATTRQSTLEPVASFNSLAYVAPAPESKPFTAPAAWLLVQRAALAPLAPRSRFSGRRPGSH